MKKQIDSNRGEKIASKTQILVGEIMLDKFIDDPIISGVSLVGSESYGRLHFVRLFYYTRSEDKAKVQKRLEEITKMVRFELAGRMEQKYVPDIKFVYDDTLERANRIDKLLGSIKLD
ncbi:MAG: ribosome-binding factor A [Alphaproteobacteria bacterium]|nr:ribosome-binding factor A [Alphaproteobacteria bacterium]MBN2675133.1 ribosome-binding factor A [Alphaproteobacteria bacterium]